MERWNRRRGRKWKEETGGEAGSGKMKQEERQRVDRGNRRRGREWIDETGGEAEGGKMEQEERQGVDG